VAARPVPAEPQQAGGPYNLRPPHQNRDLAGAGLIDVYRARGGRVGFERSIVLNDSEHLAVGLPDLEA
jgi:hypothetical protein